LSKNSNSTSTKADATTNNGTKADATTNTGTKTGEADFNSAMTANTKSNAWSNKIGIAGIGLGLVGGLVGTLVGVFVKPAYMKDGTAGSGGASGSGVPWLDDPDNQALAGGGCCSCFSCCCCLCFLCLIMLLMSSGSSGENS